MSSSTIIPSSVSLSDIRGQQAVNQAKALDPKRKAQIEKSAKDFESVLLSQWLNEAEQSFASLPGGDDDKDPGHDQLQGLGTQALGAAMSGSHGGLGIASMVARHLEKDQKATSASSEDSGKQLKLKGLHDHPDGYFRNQPAKSPIGR
jgi:Rod binding domain-containing protein